MWSWNQISNNIFLLNKLLIYLSYFNVGNSAKQPQRRKGRHSTEKTCRHQPRPANQTALPSRPLSARWRWPLTSHLWPHLLALAQVSRQPSVRQCIRTSPTVNTHRQGQLPVLHPAEIEAITSSSQVTHVFGHCCPVPYPLTSVYQHHQGTKCPSQTRFRVFIV